MSVVIPNSTDIRTINEIGAESRLIVTLEDVVNDLNISPSLKASLSELSRELAEASLYIITSFDQNGSYEGRGRYIKHEFNNQDITVYSKGVGSIKSIKINMEEPYGAFGPVYQKYLRDDGNRHFYFPRTWGALYMSGCQTEFLNSLRIFVDVINRNGIESIDDLMKANISIPISIAHFSGLGKLLQNKIQPELGEKWQGRENSVGAVTLVSPSDVRVKKELYNKSPKVAVYQCIAKTIKELFLSSTAMHVPSSVHSQNMYFSKSICPQADNTGIVFTYNLKEGERISALSTVIYRFAQLSLRQASYSKHLEVLNRMFEIFIKDDYQVKQLSYRFLDSPKSVSYKIAEHLDKIRDYSPFEPPQNIIEKIGMNNYQESMRKEQAHLLKVTNSLMRALTSRFTLTGEKAARR